VISLKNLDKKTLHVWILYTCIYEYFGRYYVIRKSDKSEGFIQIIAFMYAIYLGRS